jgi:hypothetical protein
MKTHTGTNKINSILKLDRGKGNNLPLYNIGIDLSKRVIELCKTKFNSSFIYVIIYTSNYDEVHSLHLKHRKFSNWIKKYKKDWYLKDFIKNRYEYDINKPKETTFADFYIFEKKI